LNEVNGSSAQISAKGSIFAESWDGAELIIPRRAAEAAVRAQNFTTRCAGEAPSFWMSFSKGIVFAPAVPSAVPSAALSGELASGWWNISG